MDKKKKEERTEFKRKGVGEDITNTDNIRTNGK